MLGGNIGNKTRENYSIPMLFDGGIKTDNFVNSNLVEIALTRAFGWRMIQNCERKKLANCNDSRGLGIAADCCG